MSRPRRSRRRQKGDGGLFQDKNGYWTATIELPADPITQKRRRKVVRSKKYEVARQKLRALQKELDEKGDLATATPTLDQWTAYWLENLCKPKLKPSTLADYEKVARLYILPKLRKRKMDQIGPTDLLNLYAWIQKPTTAGGLGLSSTTASKAHRVLRASFNDALKLGKAPRNPVLLVDAPRQAVTQQKVLSPDQALHFLVTHAHRPYVARFATSLFTGCRQGEALGLQVEYVHIRRDEAGTPVDVDVEFAWALQRLTWSHGCAGTCEYTRAGSCPDRTITLPAGQEGHQIHGGLFLIRPKTTGSWRVTSGGPTLAAILDRVIGDRTEGFVFTVDGDRPVDPRVDWGVWQDWLVEAGLPKMGTHAQRHTASTLLAIAGADEKTRMDMLGHTTVRVSRHYTHDDMTLQRRASAAYSQLLDFEYTATGDSRLIEP